MAEYFILFSYELVKILFFNLIGQIKLACEWIMYNYILRIYSKRITHTLNLLRYKKKLFWNKNTKMKTDE